MKAISNSSPLIALAAIERLALLPLLFDSVVIPAAVAFETRRTIPARPAWLQVQTLQNQLPAAVVRPTLGDGEREAIALALEAGADRVVLDDLPARRVAQELGLNASSGPSASCWRQNGPAWSTPFVPHSTISSGQGSS